MAAWIRAAVVVGCLLGAVASRGARADDAVPAASEEKSAAPAASVVPTWSLRFPEKDALTWRGAANFDEAGGGAMNMMYPAPNVVGMLAAVATHAFIADSVRTRQKQQLQEKADAVLNVYREVLDGFTAHDLYVRAARRMAPDAQPALLEISQPVTTGTVADVAPVFVMTQDEYALVIDAVVSIAPQGSDAALVRRVVVRVVSDPWRPATDQASLPAYWSADGGTHLKDTSAALLAQALEIARSSSAPATDDARPFKTIRYVEGKIERMERAQLLREECGRSLIRTLRGTLMSVPARGPVGAACAAE